MIKKNTHKKNIKKALTHGLILKKVHTDSH